MLQRIVIFCLWFTDIKYPTKSGASKKSNFASFKIFIQKKSYDVKLLTITSPTKFYPTTQLFWCSESLIKTWSRQYLYERSCKNWSVKVFSLIIRPKSTLQTSSEGFGGNFCYTIIINFEFFCFVKAIMQKSIYVYKNPPAGDHIQENQWLNCILSHSLDPSTIIDVVPENLFKPHKSSFGGDFLLW